MKITVANTVIPFRPWRPENGCVFQGRFAFDTETTRIDEERPWLTPAYVIGAACDLKRGFFVLREHVAEFLRVHESIPIVMHRASFDLAVMNLLVPEFDVYRWVDQDHVWDTQLLHCLFSLGKDGHVSRGKGQSTLEKCASLYLGIELPKDIEDSQGNVVRLSYGQWLNKPPQEIEPVYLEYLAKDVLATRLVYMKLHNGLKGMFEAASETWGFISKTWLVEQVRRWGWQTHHIQLKASIVLNAIKANGLTVDVERRDELVEQLQVVSDEYKATLREYGYIPGQKGSGKALQEILRRLDAKYPDLYFSRTEKKGEFKKSEDALAQLAGVEPFIDVLLGFGSVEKLLSTFLKKMDRVVLHPSFNPLVVSGRTSSFGEINAQNLPRDDRIRSCFVPSPGHVFINADYVTVEMATLAQSVLSQMQIPSRMADAINDGVDLHRLVAAHFFGKDVNDVTSDERQKAKPVNFGKPGGMGDRTLKAYAKTTYGVDLTDGQVEQLSEDWVQLFPEMKDFLNDGDDLGFHVAELFNLTPMSFYEHTGSRKFLDHPNNFGRETQPHPILGSMCLKVLKEPSPKKQSGVAYSLGEIDFFWSSVINNLESIPSKFQQVAREREPSVPLQRAVMSEVGRAAVFTLSGRLRANATYSARHNTVFQGLAADGAKLALWSLWRADYRLVNFIHDEVMVEIPVDSNLGHHAEIVRHLMISSMKRVVPDVRVDVEYAVSDHWHKGAKAVWDQSGKLTISQQAVG
jgi:hypothetical protein